jgi:hypothetical protein
LLKLSSFKFFIFLIFFPLFLFAKIVDENYTPLPPVIKIFETFQDLFSEEQKAKFQNPTLENLNSIAQQAFLRKAGTARKDIPKESAFGELITEKTVFLFQEIGDIGDIFPQNSQYDYIFLNGSTISNMDSRIKTLENLLEQGKLTIAEKTQIVFLTGERDLFENEKQEGLSTEADAAHWLWEKSSLSHLPITIVRAPKKETGGPPNTRDTIVTWMNTFSPAPGTGVSISSQPFVYYQEITLSSELPGFDIKGVGYDRYDPNNLSKNIPVYLDNLARIIYTLLQIQKSSMTRS